MSRSDAASGEQKAAQTRREIVIDIPDEKADSGPITRSQTGKADQASRMPANCGQKAAQTRPEIVIDIPDEKTDSGLITWPETGKAAAATGARDSVVSALSATAKFLVAQALAYTPAANALTIAGAIAGGISGAYTGAGLAGAAVLQSPYAENTYARYAANVLGALAGGGGGALPSILGHAPVNDVAIKQIASLVGTLVGGICKQSILKEIGPRIECTPTIGSVSASALQYVVALSVVSALAVYLPESVPEYIKDILPKAFGDGLDGVGGTVVRSFREDAELKEGKNRPVRPKAFELVNATLLRNAFASIITYAKSVAEKPVEATLGKHAGAAVSSLLTVPTAFSPLVSIQIIKGIMGPNASYSPEPGTARAPHIDDIVANPDDRRSPISIKSFSRSATGTGAIVQRIAPDFIPA